MNIQHTQTGAKCDWFSAIGSGDGQFLPTPKPTLSPAAKSTKSWKDFGPQFQHIPNQKWTTFVFLISPFVTALNNSVDSAYFFVRAYIGYVRVAEFWVGCVMYLCYFGSKLMSRHIGLFCVWAQRGFLIIFSTEVANRKRVHPNCTLEIA